ncbi:MAG: SRPBCC domain-containing protein [Leptospiraceae bacterium]|nr:SRPBCC domain-containing protein [Leptospiraceae bacterium]MCB1320644.1 SRPBCC domain-containing protein [Leptospiraceae bacterium]
MNPDLRLEIRRWIDATPAVLFDAWTEPELLKRWWGPENVECPEAHVDLKPGGSYRIANAFPDGNVVWINGEFLEIQRPQKLVYTWCIGEEDSESFSEKVTVFFQPVDGGTEILIIHEGLRNRKIRESHRLGWIGCLDGLQEFVKEK